MEESRVKHVLAWATGTKVLAWNKTLKRDTRVRRNPWLRVWILRLGQFRDG